MRPWNEKLKDGTDNTYSMKWLERMDNGLIDITKLGEHEDEHALCGLPTKERFIVRSQDHPLPVFVLSLTPLVTPPPENSRGLTYSQASNWSGVCRIRLSRRANLSQAIKVVDVSCYLPKITWCYNTCLPHNSKDKRPKGAIASTKACERIDEVDARSATLPVSVERSLHGANQAESLSVYS